MDHNVNKYDWTAFSVARAKTSSRPSHSALSSTSCFYQFSKKA